MRACSAAACSAGSPTDPAPPPQSGEGEIRRAIVEADLVDDMVAMPSQLFYSTQIPVCLWFLACNKNDGKLRDRRGETLFIDARKLGTLVDRVHRELPDADIQRFVSAYHSWRDDKGAGTYEDVAGFCKSAALDEIKSHGHVLTPGRYVGAEEVEDDGEPFEVKMKRLVWELAGQQAEAARLDAVISGNLKARGYAVDENCRQRYQPESLLTQVKTASDESWPERCF